MIIDLLRWNIEREVAHWQVRIAQITVIGLVSNTRAFRGSQGRAIGAVVEPEEGKQSAVANLEDEVMPRTVGQLDVLDQRHTQHVAIKGDRPFHLAADQAEMIDPAQFKVPILGSWFGAHMSLRAHALWSLLWFRNVFRRINASVLAERPASKVLLETDYAA
jgi:hypothetical protein